MARRNENGLSAGELIGGYEIVHTLGRGGFGITYRAVDQLTGRQWVIKEFYPGQPKT